MKKNNPSGFVDFTRGSELWIHQFKMFLTGISNVLILGLFFTVLIVGGFLYLKVQPVELYAAKTEIEILFKKSVKTPNNQIQLSLNGQMKTVSLDEAEKIVAPYAKNFWWDLKRAIFLGIFLSFFIVGLVIWYWYTYGRKVMSDEQLRGAKLVEKETLNEMLVNRNEVGKYKVGGVPIRKGTEGNNICFIGAPQSGKSQAIRALLEQIRANNKKNVVYDPSGEFTQEFYRPGKDIILNPFDDRCPRWSVWDEVREDHHIDSIADGLIPLSNKSDDFFPPAARRLIADVIRVLSQNPNTKTNQCLFETISLSTLSELHELLAGTSGATYVDPKTEKTGINIKMQILNYLTPFKFLKDQGESFSIRDWVELEDDSWIFITTKEEQKEAIKPIISLWLTTVIKATMSLPAIHKERMWLCIDEMPTLQKMDDLVLSLTNTRKYGLCHIIGIQGLSQLDQNYGKDNAATIISTLQTKLILRVTDSESAERLAKIIGQMEVDEKNMSRSMGVTDGRDGDSFYGQRKERNVVMPSEIMNLPNMEGYLILVGDYPVAKVKTTYVPHAVNAIPFIPRKQIMKSHDYDEIVIARENLNVDMTESVSSSDLLNSKNKNFDEVNSDIDVKKNDLNEDDKKPDHIPKVNEELDLKPSITNDGISENVSESMELKSKELNEIDELNVEGGDSKTVNEDETKTKYSNANYDESLFDDILKKDN